MLRVILPPVGRGGRLARRQIRQSADEERCARWLLLTHDRCEQDTLALTHERLGYMLGTRRPGVTVARGIPQHAGLRTSHHGDAIIADRDGLKNTAYSCYRAVTTEYNRLIGGYAYAR